MKPTFKPWRRFEELRWKSGLSEAESIELRALHSAFEHFRQQHPEWQAGDEPLRVSFLEAAHFSGRTTYPKKRR